MSEKKLTYGFNVKSQKMVSINDVPSGLECGLVCANCEEPLIARKGEHNMHHFAHYSGYECIGGYESAIHKLAKQILQKEKSLYFPEYRSNNWKYRRISIPGWKGYFGNVRIEEGQSDIKLRPDSIIADENGIEYWIEFNYKHKINEEKKRKIIESKIECVEIDLEGIELEEVEEYILNSYEGRRWINHPKGEIEIENIYNSSLSIEKNNQTEYKKSEHIKSVQKIPQVSSMKNLKEYTKNHELFEREERKVFQRRYKESKPEQCPIRNSLIAFNCENCKYKIGILPSGKGFSEIVCGYYSKKKNI